MDTKLNVIIALLGVIVVMMLANMLGITGKSSNAMMNRGGAGGSLGGYQPLNDGDPN